MINVVNYYLSDHCGLAPAGGASVPPAPYGALLPLPGEAHQDRLDAPSPGLHIKATGAGPMALRATVARLGRGWDAAG